MSLLRLFIVCIASAIVISGCENGSTGPEEEEAAIEIRVAEAQNIGFRAVTIHTTFNFKKPLQYNSSIWYDLFISKEEAPDNSNSVDFFDATLEEGIVDYNEEESEGVIINPISELEPATTYYFRIRVGVDNYTQMTETTSFTTKEESYEETGGIQIYDKESYSDGWRYLVAAPPGWNGSENDPYVAWGCEGVLVDSTSFETGMGLPNTQRIIENGCATDGESPTAAELADELELNGFDDWFLPSLDELKHLISTRDAGLDGRSAFYWSSKERDTTTVFILNSNWMQEWTEKGSKVRVRPIRRY